tara:strand:- start:321 stop:488 length:168 start_codon:yes stop_codon:yes gene_type:complete
MKSTENNSQAKTEDRPGFFKRMVIKLDSSMKAKADAKAEEPCCSSSDDKKNGKCC